MASHLCTYTLATGKVTEVMATERLVEAPNWTRDGTSLLINGDGRLYLVALAKPAMVEVDTGFAVKCNNDHGISPDGTMLVISDGTRDGASAVYTLPFTGGTPTRITPDTPSYWHGWSPDGATLACVAKRGGAPYAICTVPVGGGTETVLTKGFEHTDGPDYTPDGEWIWFNGQKAGRMQLWRMHPDGSGLQQMTDDERWNWFPHPSPDGRHVVYVAFEPGVTGHPRDKDVQLRLLPAEGGTPRVLHALFGGQGTINVPSWAPDGSAFAFMEYDRP